MSEVVIADPKELLKDLLQLQETHGPLGEGDNGESEGYFKV